MVIAVLSAAGLSGCSVEEWRSADLQLDITDSDLSDEVRIRICVDGHGVHAGALKAGRLAFAGLPVTGPLQVRVDALEDRGSDTGESVESLVRSGRAGPSELSGDDPYQTVPWTPCSAEDSDCTVCEACSHHHEN